MKIYNDYFEELIETHGVTRTIFVAERYSYADSPESTNSALVVFINADTNMNEYRVQFFHYERNGFISEIVIDKVEKFDNLYCAIQRFDQVNNVIHNVLMEMEAKKRREQA